MNKKKNKFEDTFITILGWMVTVLDLKGNELIAFALINGFSQDGENEFKGSIKYIQKWMNCSRRTVINTVDSLVQKKYVIKRQEEISGVVFNRYSINWDLIEYLKVNFTPSAKNAPPPVQKMHGGGVQNLHPII